MDKSMLNHKRAISMIMFLALAVCFLALMTTLPAVHATAQNSSKSHTPNATFHVGDTVTFTTTIGVYTDATFITALSISNLTITDPLPVGETFNTGTNTSTPSSVFTATWNGTNWILFWDFGVGPFATAPQAVVSYHITVNSNASAGYLFNVATYTYDETLSGAHSAPGISDNILIAASPPPPPPPTVGGYDVAPNYLAVLLGFAGPWIIAVAASAAVVAVVTVVVKKTRRK